MDELANTRLAGMAPHRHQNPLGASQLAGMQPVANCDTLTPGALHRRGLLWSGSELSASLF